MIDLDAVSGWLNIRLAVSVVSEVWIFGSVLYPNQPHNDVDVFIKYMDGYSHFIPYLRRETQAGFFERFGSPLHLLFLSHSESTEAAQFLKSALSGGLRVR